MYQLYKNTQPKDFVHFFFFFFQKVLEPWLTGFWDSFSLKQSEQNPRCLKPSFLYCFSHGNTALANNQENDVIYFTFCLCRNYTGQDLDPLSYKELHHLEQKIDTALKSVRSRKVKFKMFVLWDASLFRYTCCNACSWCKLISNLQNQLVHESLAEMQKKVRFLLFFFYIYSKISALLFTVVMKILFMF
jgi:hypothetical protein